ncbi:MAG: tRNA 4-thiouridine(8) synthase ThiI [Clostridiales bacterium]|nr:tRNA 4-thiouridine(8) synthase ThiI [Clostridiales bacterium]
MDDRNIFITRYGEVALKGLNKPYFERVLVEGVRKATRQFGDVEVKRREGLVFVRAPKEAGTAKVAKEISKVFGVASVSPAVETESTLESIGEAAALYMQSRMEEGAATFKIESKRADKSFPVKSPDISRIIGAKVLDGCQGLKVDVHKPDCLLFVDVRKGKSYIYEHKIQGFGGLPLGTNGKGLVLLSGGIDSPVAAFMMAKRGMLIEAVHFHSYPYTSERAQQKAVELASILSAYCGRFLMHMVNLLPVQEQIALNCPEEEMTVLVRRFMMRIAEDIAKKSQCTMLITGESLGQVASQTAEALVVTDASVSMPVMRPLIALDKVDIIDKAREIGTYETSIQPYEDCCTVFLPKHPVTKPKLEKILLSESKLDAESLARCAVMSRETVSIGQG